MNVMTIIIYGGH